MTTTPEPLEHKVNGLETALGRLAELSFNNAARHDHEITQLLEVTRRNSEAVRSHDDAIAQLLEVTSRNSQAVSRHDQAIAQLLEVTSRNSEAVTRHDEVLSRLEASSVRHDQTLALLVEVTSRNSQAITNLTNTVANNNGRIEQILEYLRNRNGGSSPL